MTKPLEAAIYEALCDLRTNQDYVTVSDIVTHLLSPDERDGAAGCEDSGELVDAVRAYMENPDRRGD